MGQHGLDDFRQRNQAQEVSHGHPRLAHGVGNLLLGQLELLLQALQGHGLLDRIEVLALDVLDQRHGDRRLVADLAHQRRNAFQAGQLAGAPAAFAGDDLVALAIDRAHHDRLHQPLAADRVGQLLECLRVHVAARLVLATLQQVQRQLLQFIARRPDRLILQGVDAGATEQGVQATAESAFLHSHVRLLKQW
ncbi:hypothetical protein D3C81_916040 [compost metagenome]